MKEFQIREAEISDIDQIMLIRRSVKENMLSNPDRVTNGDCELYITQRGKGWVAVSGNQILGFAIADLADDNIWAMFIHPDHENRGIGMKLHDTMLDWYFAQGKTEVWLSTDPDTRASGFYKKLGWRQTGLLPNGEMKFVMKATEWEKKKYRKH